MTRVAFTVVAAVCALCCINGASSAAEQPSNAMLGKWCYKSNDITISVHKGSLNNSVFDVRGDALDDSGGAAPHTGDLGFTARPIGSTLYHLKDGDCSAVLILNQGKLEVADNKSCGGMNVSFDGVYMPCK